MGGHMCIVRWERYPAEKSSTRTLARISIHAGHPSWAIAPAGRNLRASIAASDASSQFERNDKAVKLRFAVRRPCRHGLARNIGTAVSSKAPIAITLRMMVTLVKKSRALIGSSSLIGILEARSAPQSDNYLIFMSGSKLDAGDIGQW